MIGNGLDSNFAEKGFIYSDGVYTEMLPLPGCDGTYISAINDNGLVVGESYSGSRNYTNRSISKVFIYREGTYTELGYTYAIPADINENGVVVGRYKFIPQRDREKGFIALPK